MCTIERDRKWQLEQLDSCDNSIAGSARLTESHLTNIVSPIQMHFWRRELNQHPDQQFAALILKGLQYGFRIGFNDTLVALRQNKQNLLSAVEHPEAVKKFIAKELEEDRIARIGPKTSAGTSFIHLNPLGAIPKKGRINQWRLIMDLSSPNEHSVNDGISKDICTCHCISVSLCTDMHIKKNSRAIVKTSSTSGLCSGRGARCLR